MQGTLKIIGLPNPGRYSSCAVFGGMFWMKNLVFLKNGWKSRVCILSEGSRLLWLRDLW